MGEVPIALSDDEEFVLKSLEGVIARCKSVIKGISVVELDQDWEGALKEAPPPSVEGRDGRGSGVGVHEMNLGVAPPCHRVVWSAIPGSIAV